MAIQLSKREKSMLVIMLLALAVFAYTQLYLQPMNEEIEKVGNQIHELQARLVAAGSTESDFISQEASDQQKLGTKEWNMEKNSEIAYNIMMIVEKAGVALKQMELGDTAVFKKEQHIYYIPVNLSVSGSVQKLTGIGTQLESQGSTMEIRQMDFKGTNLMMGQRTIATSTSDAAIAAAAELQVNIRLYYIGVE